MFRSHSIRVTFEDVIRKCVWALATYLDMDETTVNAMVHASPNSEAANWFDIISRDTSCGVEKKAEMLARLICFSASEQLNDPCMWGMREALLSGPVCVRDSLAYIWKHNKTTSTPLKITSTCKTINCACRPIH